jgi:tetratricopeptide (TPR) repeat protein
MTNIKILLIGIIFSLSACGQKLSQHTVNADAIALNKRAMSLLFFINNSDSANKAIRLLDSATALDSNFYSGYYSKLMFFAQLNQYYKAIETINHMIRLRPKNYELYSTGAIMYDKLGDSISSEEYLQKSLEICTKVLDTMSVQNRNYHLMNKALILIMLGHQTDGNLLLKMVYEDETDSVKKEWIHSYMNKSKREIIEMIFAPAKAETSAIIDSN